MTGAPGTVGSSWDTTRFEIGFVGVCREFAVVKVDVGGGESKGERFRVAAQAGRS